MLQRSRLKAHTLAISMVTRDGHMAVTPRAVLPRAAAVANSDAGDTTSGEFPGGTEQTLSSNEASAGSVATLHAEVLHALTSAQHVSLPCSDLAPLSLRQILFNNAIPDHEPSKEDVYLPEKRTPEHHPLVQCLLGGFGNWDSEYFIMIAEGKQQLVQ